MGGRSLFKCILSSLDGGYNETVQALGRLEVELAEYYRLIRNKFLHAGDADVHKDVDGLRSRVRESIDYFRLSAPNAYADISFDDFILFSRVVKKIGLGLCSVARPDDAEIATMLIDACGRSHPIVNLAKLKENARSPERLQHALGTLIRTVYSLNEDNARSLHAKRRR
jgi:hypothetical protein